MIQIIRQGALHYKIQILDRTTIVSIIICTSSPGTRTRPLPRETTLTQATSASEFFNRKNRLLAHCTTVRRPLHAYMHWIMTCNAVPVRDFSWAQLNDKDSQRTRQQK